MTICDLDPETVNDLKNMIWDYDLTKQQAISYYFYQKGNTMQEIAEMLDIKQPNVSAHISKAKVKIIEKTGVKLDLICNARKKDTFLD
ncbi:MAG: helix-turn-helix transcriptional regulator [Candidatus Methanogranum gryphiswaldense]|nr:MAG: helix-turn-helix transcriptional regulator [Candidatus Methanogranum sp. U3.2.1]